MKKTEQQTYRLSELDKKELATIAEEMDIPAASIVASLVTRFVKARKNHSTRLIWPPEFNYYPETLKSVLEERDSLDQSVSDIKHD